MHEPYTCGCIMTLTPTLTLSLLTLAQSACTGLQFLEITSLEGFEQRGVPMLEVRRVWVLRHGRQGKPIASGFLHAQTLHELTSIAFAGAVESLSAPAGVPGATNCIWLTGRADL